MEAVIFTPSPSREAIYDAFRRHNLTADQATARLLALDLERRRGSPVEQMRDGVPLLQGVREA